MFPVDAGISEGEMLLVREVEKTITSTQLVLHEPVDVAVNILENP